MAKLLQVENKEDALLDESPPRDGSSSSQPPVEEEGVLRDILEELDRERSRRAELEAQVRVLTESMKYRQDDVDSSCVVPDAANNQSSTPASQLDNSNEQLEEAAALRHKLISMEAQVEGLHQLLDALTSGKPALSREASSSSSAGGERSAVVSSGTGAAAPSLPLHTLRLLEIIPWEAHEQIFGTEVLYEWQCMVDTERQIWQSQLRHFPFAVNLPIVAPESSSGPDGSSADKPGRSSKDRSLLEFLAGASSSNSSSSTGKVDSPARNKARLGTFTDEHISRLYNLDAGYALPAEGTWEWVGGWRVVVKKRKSATRPTTGKEAIDGQTTTHLDCDTEGWSYASDPQHFLHSPELVWDSPFDRQPHPSDDPAASHLETANHAPNAVEPVVRTFRRRKWIRRRILVDYPFASERTKQYLKVLAENSRLSVSLDKVSTQLVETKTRLTETEAELMKLKSEVLVKDALLLQHSSQHNRSGVLHDGPVVGSTTGLKSAVMGSVEGGNKVLHDLLSSKNEIGSKLSQWVHSTTTATTRKGSEDLSASQHDHGKDGNLDGSTHEGGSIGNGGNVNPPPLVPHGGGDDLSDSQHSRFDWKKIGRGTLLERLAKGGHPPRGSDASTISTVRSTGSSSIPEEEMETGTS